MDELYFDFEVPPPTASNHNLSQESTTTTTTTGSRRTTSTNGSSIRTSQNRRRRTDRGAGNGSDSLSSSTEIVSSTDQSRRRSKHSSSKLRFQPKQPRYHSDELEDEMASTVSSSSSKESASTNTVPNTTAVSVVRSKNGANMVRGGMSGVFAVQDAGNYQMLHDECAFLCSTILSRRRNPATAVDSIIDLVTILSSRKTRAILWLGGQQQQQQYDDTPNFGQNWSTHTSTDNVPKVWRSILEIIAVMTQQNTGISPKTNKINNAEYQRNSAANNNNLKIPSPIKPRTKAARRKQKDIIQDGGGDGVGESSVVNSSVGSVKYISGLTVEMKEALACLIYFLSCDCTMSPTKSVAAMGTVKMPSLARKIRLAILEYGQVISGVVRLIVPPSNDAKVAQTFDETSTWDSNRYASAFIRNTTSFKDQRDAKSPPRMNLSARMDHARCPPPPDPLSPRTDQKVKDYPSKRENPAKLGRFLRLKRKRLAEESSERQETDLEASIPLLGTSDKGLESADEDSKMMPPPSKRKAVGQKNAAQRTLNNDEQSFRSSSVASRGDFSFPSTDRTSEKASGSNLSWDEDVSIGSDSSGLTSTLSTRATRKLTSLRSKVQLDAIGRSNSKTGDLETNLQEAFYCERALSVVDAELLPAGDYPWITMVCLESLCRITTGKEEGGTSCLEGDDTMGTRGSQNEEDSSDSDEDDESRNPIVMTNHLLGKSGAVPLLGKAMSQSVLSSQKLIFTKNQRIVGSLGGFEGSELREDEECWKYCQDRLSLLACIIDGACLLSESNRRGFCEEDPFAFEERKDGLIFQIITFLRQCNESNLHEEDKKRSAAMLLALRTLTSLTHDNSLAAEQMASSYNVGINCVRGVEILAELIFRLEEPLTVTPSKAGRANNGAATNQQSPEHDMHRYDCTIFCFNTLANVIEGRGVRKVLSEMTVQPESLGAISWLKWLCQWFAKQTESFHTELMSIGKDRRIQGSAKQVTPAVTIKSYKRNGTNHTSNEQDAELHKHEEEKLVAAGNCCVLLACIMTEPENDDGTDFSTIAVRKLIVEEMPESIDGEQPGISMIINTLKAFCNFYHLSLGELSLAVVAPVKKLILELEEVKVDHPTEDNGPEWR
ncbi:hypothetical protein IV203_029447 [Nitzschia inconspicua]|uniref:Uncharacterized protein n=1 Tax=Nitzschia inconspicua TaxID=303405 RepID=A0A9K3Q0G0_9STRA|nr:hypothetical protein IV203_029447 [Nitzschia inconspicua]